MIKTIDKKIKLKAYERSEEHIQLEEDKQIYFEIKKGNPKVIVSFLDDENKEIVTKVLPNIAFIKPFTNTCKILVINESEYENEVEYKIVTGVRIYE